MFFDIDAVQYYFYRCIDSKGNLIGCYLGKRRNTDTIIRFLKLCKHNSKLMPSEIVTDGYVCYNLAIPSCFDTVKHTVVKPSRNYIEQDNRWIRQRANSFIGLKKYSSTNIFFNLFELLKNYFRIKKYKNQFVSLKNIRNTFFQRFELARNCFEKVKYLEI
jgi:transposase-like protein